MADAQTIFVVVGPRCYGSGATLKQAISRCRCAYPTYRANKYEMPFNAYTATPDWEIDGHGTLSASKLTKLREVRFIDGKRSERNAAPWHPEGT